MKLKGLLIYSIINKRKVLGLLLVLCKWIMGANDPAPKCNLDSRFDFTRSIKLKFNIISQIRDFLWWIGMCFKSLYWMSGIDRSRNHHHYSLLSWFSTVKKVLPNYLQKLKFISDYQVQVKNRWNGRFLTFYPFYTICLIYELNG